MPRKRRERRKRERIPLIEKLAAALRCMMVEEDGKLVPAIPYEIAKQMTAEQVLSLFAWDHGILHADGGPDLHWNLTPRFIAEHRLKSAKVDVPAFYKGERLSEAHKEFQRRVLALKLGEGEAPPKKPSRLPKGRKLQSNPEIKSRPFDKRPRDRARVPRFNPRGV